MVAWKLSACGVTLFPSVLMLVQFAPPSVLSYMVVVVTPPVVLLLPAPTA